MGNRKKDKRRHQLLNSLTTHHVPPVSNGWTHEDGFTLTKTLKEHRAYHLIFGNASSLEECIEILERYWWTRP